MDGAASCWPAASSSATGGQRLRECTATVWIGGSERWPGQRENSWGHSWPKKEEKLVVIALIHAPPFLLLSGWVNVFSHWPDPAAGDSETKTWLRKWITMITWPAWCLVMLMNPLWEVTGTHMLSFKTTQKLIYWWNTEEWTFEWASHSRAELENRDSRVWPNSDCWDVRVLMFWDRSVLDFLACLSFFLHTFIANTKMSRETFQRLIKPLWKWFSKNGLKQTCVWGVISLSPSVLSFGALVTWITLLLSLTLSFSLCSSFSPPHHLQFLFSQNLWWIYQKKLLTFAFICHFVLTLLRLSRRQSVEFSRL